MAKTNKERLKDSYYKDIVKSRIKAKEKHKKRRDRNKWYIYNYLLSHPCVDCGEKDPIVLEFDHVRGTKIKAISELAMSCGLKKIQEEIDKCEVRCANCHRRKTAKQFSYYTVTFLESETMES